MRSLALLFLSFALYGQQVVNQVDGPPAAGSTGSLQVVNVINGSNYTIGICWSPSVLTTRANTFISISAISKANPAVITSTGHGIHASTRPLITISGATGTGWATGINGANVATVIDANTFSVPVDSSGFGTLAGTVVFVTTGPRTTIAEWSARKYLYDGSNNLINRSWLNGTSGYTSKCSDVTSTSIRLQ